MCLGECSLQGRTEQSYSGSNAVPSSRPQLCLASPYHAGKDVRL